VVLDAFRADVPITGDRVVAFADTFTPTRPFRDAE
jgi:hypothetical protein